MHNAKSWRSAVSRCAVLLAGCLFVVGAAPAHAQSPIDENRPAPELVGRAWLNTSGGETPTLAARKGKVTIVHFWTSGCINCKHNLPTYNAWYRQFRHKDVTVIGIHTPETPGERSVANVARADRRWGIEYPVLVDSQSVNWDRWSQHYWPTVYLVDRHGKIRYRWEGELEFDNAGGAAKMAHLVDTLLKEP